MKNSYSDTQPLISIIIPMFNAEQFIEKTVSNALQQDYENFEIIIIDDGSTDSSLDILKLAFSDNQKVKIFSQENKGVSGARNTGLLHSKGDFVCFLDSDDKLAASFISKLLPRMLSDQLDVQFCRYHHHSLIEKEPIIGVDSKNILIEYLQSNARGKLAFHIGSLLVRRDFLEIKNIYFNEDLFYGEDILFIYKLLSLGECAAIADKLYHYNYRKESAMNRPWQEKDYLHDIYAFEIINMEVQDVYKGQDREVIVKKLSNILLDRKIRYLWKLFLSNKLSKVRELYNDNYLDISLECDLSKKSKKRIKIFSLNNIFIWKIIRFFYSNKVNL